MRTDTTILAQLDQKFQWMHAYRRRLLCELTLTLVRSGRGWLTALGRDLRSPAHAKHRIKRVDRFVGNARLHADLPQAYQSLCQWVIQSARPVILVDWTTLTDTHWLLVASVPCQGRAHIIVQEAHKKKRVATPQVQRPFLTALSRIVPPECTPIVISDAGFMGPWFGVCANSAGTLSADCLPISRSQHPTKKSKKWRLCVLSDATNPSTWACVL